MFEALIGIVVLLYLLGMLMTYIALKLVEDMGTVWIRWRYYLMIIFWPIPALLTLIITPFTK